MYLIIKHTISPLALIVVSLLLLFPSTMHAQVPEQKSETAFEIVWSNDFVNQTDRYFSNGFDLAFYHRIWSKLPTSYLLVSGRNASKVVHSLTLSQHLFTPDKLTQEDIVAYDRPFASYLLLGHQKTSFFKARKIKLTSEIQLGLLGKYSGGESVQNGVHTIFADSDIALGWPNQLKSDFAFNYNLKVEKGLVYQNHFAMIPYAGFRAGVPYTDADAGIQMRAGWFPDYFNNIGLLSEKDLILYAFVDISGRYVLYNATLQGGLFNESLHTISNVTPFVRDLKLGFSVGVKNFTFEYSQHFISKEYDSGRRHKWGSFSFRFGF